MIPTCRRAITTWRHTAGWRPNSAPMRWCTSASTAISNGCPAREPACRHPAVRTPRGQARVNLVLAMLRAKQMWGGKAAALPGLREALGLSEQGDSARSTVDEVEETAHRLIQAMEDRGWQVDTVAEVVKSTFGAE